MRSHRAITRNSLNWPPPVLNRARATVDTGRSAARGSRTRLKRPGASTRIRSDAPYAAYCLEGPEQFTIHLPVSNGELSREAVVLAQTVLGSVSEMDAAARAYTRALYGTHDDESYAAQLAYIEVPETGNKVIFRYFAANLNADWNDSFNVERDGRWQHCPLTN